VAHFRPWFGAALIAIALIAAIPVLGGWPHDPVLISEIRVHQAGADVDEYFELTGLPGAMLDELTYIVIGDGPGGGGCIEASIDLSGYTIPDSGYFVVAESGYTLGAPDHVHNLNFENNDNVTHLLVSGFTAHDGVDLDIDDDGVLDSKPWDQMLDLIALIEEDNPPTGTVHHYGPPTIGPDGASIPGHVYRCADGWHIGHIDIAAGLDTPGQANPCDAPTATPTASPMPIPLIYVPLLSA